ncbi:MAG: hypothetical protein IKX23_11575 [Treponema sp.]|nr:hypothetical protein [Treponema sp.]
MARKFFVILFSTLCLCSLSAKKIEMKFNQAKTNPVSTEITVLENGKQIFSDKFLNYQIIDYQIEGNIILINYKYVPGEFGYPLYHDFYATLYLSVNKGKVTELFNVIKSCTVTDGPRYKLLKFDHKDNSYSVEYDFQRYENRYVSYGTVKIVYKVDKKGVAIENFNADVNGYVVETYDDGMCSYGPGGKKVPNNIKQDEFIKQIESWCLHITKK